MNNKYFFSIIIFILVLLLTILISSTTLLSWLDNNLYDLFLSNNISKNKSDNIVIVKIDDKSLAKLGQWPWRRDIYAKLINKLSNNKANLVAFYLDFSLPTNPDIDEVLIQALKKHPTVVINPYLYIKENNQNTFWQKMKKETSWGHDRLITFKDNVVRDQSPVLNYMPSFALSVLNKYDPEEFRFYRKNNTLMIKEKILEDANNIKLPINFKHSWNQFPAYSFSDVIENNFSANAFKNKIVVVGITKETLAKDFTTPLSKKYSYSGKDSSVYVQAQLIDSLLNNKLINIVDLRIIYIILVLIIALEIYLIRFTNLFGQVLTFIFVIPAISIFVSFLMLHYKNIWLSPTLFIISSIFLFVILITSQILKVSIILDKYIFDLTKKSEVAQNKPSGSAVDTKLEKLKEITDIIENDRSLFDTVLASANSIIILFDKTGRIVYSNCEKKKLNLNEYLKLLNFEEVISEIDLNSIFRKDLTAKNKHYELLANKANEDCYVGVFNDITGIVNSNEMKASLLRILSHELKAPISTILLSSDYLLSHIQETKYKNYLEKILTQADFIQELIDKFLELNKLELAELDLRIEPIDINYLISNILEDFSIIASSRKIEITNNLLPITTIIKADKNYLAIVFKNLLDNAIKYSNPETKIIISSEITEDKYKISFKDQGIGIPEDEIGKLFNKFYRIKNEKVTNIKGYGLGLSFVKKIIDLHGGEITVKSQLNVGTEFNIFLPQ